MQKIGRLITAMVTPFNKEGKVNYERAKKLALALLTSGSTGLVVVGTTGESPTLTREEELRLFSEIKSAVGERGTIIAGTGSNNTVEALETTKEAEQIQKQTFHLHVNSFQSRDNAEAETGRLTRLGYQAFLREEDVSGQAWFRVYVGAFPSEKDAREQGEILKGKGVIGYFKPLRFEMK